MPDEVVAVNNLGKAYRRYPSMKSRVVEWLDPRRRARHQLQWVLEGITFNVSAGEAVGVVGLNGAGKSTLLKLIAGIAYPTVGTVRTKGRISALLELGIGFHPDLTGRQNIQIVGQLLGMRSDQVSTLMPDIEHFAEIGDFIDQPLRLYSSGMQVRLAFSLATATRPDLLIVDEALSVGDAYFQHKCLERIRSFRSLGTSLLIVSHDAQAVLNMCSRVILLQGGQLIRDGDPAAVMDFYNAMLAERELERIRQVPVGNSSHQTISGNGAAIIDYLGLYDSDGHELVGVSVGQTVALRVSATVTAAISDLSIGYAIKDRFGRAVFGTNTAQMNVGLPPVSIGGTISCHFVFAANLGPGSYSVSVALHSSETHVTDNYQWIDLALLFEVVPIPGVRFEGVAWLPPKFELLP